MTGTRASESSPSRLLADPRLARIGIVLGALFALLVGLSLHGFSLARWHAVIDGSEPTEVLLGSPRAIRADDWLVQLPLAYAQAAHEPPFPVVNRNLGTGQNMLLPIELPVAHPTTLFRPAQWGFFLGDDLGTAWLWWSQVLGTWFAFLLVLLVVCEGRLAAAAAGAALLVVSPVHQMWSFSKATLGIAMGLAFVATVGIASARTRRALAGLALLLGASGAAFALVVYPPSQVSLAQLYLVLVLGWGLQPRARAAARERAGRRLAALAGATCLAAAVVAVFLLDAREAIEALGRTVYPGRRIATGGDAPVLHLLTASFGSALFVSDWGPLANVSEASSFWLTFPVSAAVLWLRRSRDPVAIALALFCVAAALYRELGLPAWAARLSLLSWVPGGRTTLALGIADGLLLARVLAVRRGTRAVSRREALALAAGFGLAVAAGGLALRRDLPELPPGAVAAGAAASGAVALAVARGARAAPVLAAMALALGATTLGFNPLARGGADYLRENPLSRRILAVDAARGGDTRWITYGSSDLANLIRVLGLPSIGGNTNLPPREIWEHLDPQGRARAVWDRYAHVGFRPPAAPGDPPRFHLSSPQGFIVALDPRGEALRDLGVTHLLVRLRRSSLAYWARFEPIEAIAPDLLIYELPLRPRSDAAGEGRPTRRSGGT